MELESYRSATGPVGPYVSVFPSPVSPRHPPKTAVSNGPELAPGWYFVDSTHQSEQNLDGLYLLRTDLGAAQRAKQQVLGNYKNLLTVQLLFAN
jgi:hypothetical protein